MDLVVTVPRGFWHEWIAEGDAVGEPASGEEWGFTVGYNRPSIYPGDRLYIVAWDMLRGYAPVTRVAKNQAGQWAICRGGGAVAVTIPEPIKGFRGWRSVWWDRSFEQPFPDWKTEGVLLPRRRAS